MIIRDVIPDVEVNIKGKVLKTKDINDVVINLAGVTVCHKPESESFDSPCMTRLAWRDIKRVRVIIE